MDVGGPELQDFMPLTHSMSTRLDKLSPKCAKRGVLELRPGGKTQVTIEYLQHPDGSIQPKKIHTGVISTQHAEPLGYTSPEAERPTASSHAALSRDDHLAGSDTRPLS